MFWEMFAAFLAAAGLILLIWCTAGALLRAPGTAELEAVYRCRDSAPELEQTVRRFVWLHESGLWDAPLKIVDCGLAPDARRRAGKLAARYGYIRIEAEEGLSYGASTGADPRQRGWDHLSE
ncbi:MAG: hypothetical protein HFF17_00925 [Oscillospiraceae bacterium]|nr:hypothetical protein [Oscillospiraceae bacterium]